MKRISAIIMALTAFLAVSCAVAQTPEEIAETKELVSNALDNHEFTIEVDHIFPVKFAPRISTDGYKMTVKDGKVTAHLPFIGESHMSMYANDDIGITMEEVPVDIVYAKIKKDDTLSFIAKAENGTYDVTVTIFNNGNADISCRSNNRSMMRYSGKLIKQQ